jgi:hypothetical protein
VYVVDKIVDAPEQIMRLEPALTRGTNTLTVAVFVQPLASVPVTVYTVVVAGVATGFEIFASLRPVTGDQT